MDRRLAGIVVLILALVVVVVVPSLDGRRVAGSASVIAFPDPPAVGDCLRSPLVQSSGSAGLVSEVRVTEVDLGPCGEVLNGEVVAFWATRSAARAAPSSRFGGPCYPQAAEFAGLATAVARSTDIPGRPPGGAVRWKPTISFRAFRVVPGELEQRAGRGWSACLVVPSSGSGYRPTLRNAVTDGLPSGFALCWAGTDLGLMPTVLPCDQPHPAELVATGWVRDRSTVTIPELDEACVDIAGRLMGTADPTRGGQLQTVADRMTSQTDGRSDGPLTVGCFVTGTAAEQLSGSVIGLGDRAVPFAQ